MEKAHITIIGGGYSGTLVLHHLVHGSATPLRITLLDRAGKFGKGVAYSTLDEAHLLNVPATNMSALPDQPDHFVKWLKAANKFTEGRSFYSRKDYGDYISSILSNAIEAANEKGIEIELLSSEATSLQPASGETYEIQLADGKRWSSEIVVMALGNFPPGSFTQLFPHLKDDPRFITKFWTHPIFPFIPKTSRVGIIGTGLSMVDAALSLQSRGHSGKIYAFSRNGFLPKVHQPKNTAYQFAIPAEAKASPLRLLKCVRQEIREQIKKGGRWTDVLDSLRPHSNAIWMGWTPNQKRQFFKRLRPFWDTHRHRMAPEVWQKMELLLGNKTLEILPAKILSIRSGSKQLEISLRRKKASSDEIISVDYLIDCSGPESDYRKLNEPIIQSLVKSTKFEIDPTGMGLRTASSLAKKTGLFLIGPLNKGNLFETTAVPELRLQAVEVSKNALELLK